jgi:hypothetical protein
MVVDPLMRCRLGFCPECGSENISCVEERKTLDGEDFLRLSPLLERITAPFAQKVTIKCVCKSCGYRWKCEKLPFAIY